MQINDFADIRAKNIKTIINCVRRMPVITKKEIAAQTGLSVATVFNLCNELKALNILEEQKTTTYRVGRTPAGVSLCKSRHYFFALDFRLEYMVGMAIINLQNEVVYQTVIDTSHIDDPDEVLRYVRDRFDEIVAMLNMQDVSFVKIGAAVPAIFDAIDGRLKTCAIELFDNYPMKQKLQEIFGMGAYVDNVTNLFAWSVYSEVRDPRPIVCLDVSQGVGVGLVVNGQLIRGINGYGGEIAHAPVGDPESLCPICGKRGCAEILLSVRGMTDRIPDIPKTIPLQQRWKRFVSIMNDGRPDTQALSQEIGTEMGKLISILINLFDPSYFGLSGYIIDIIDCIKSYMYDEVDSRCALSIKRGLKIDIYQTVFGSIYSGIGNALYESWNPVEEVSKPQ